MRKYKKLDRLREEMEEKLKDFYPNTNGLVIGIGNLDAKIVLIGEGPGREEDLQGKPFVGRSGKLLDKVMKEVGLERESLYITNVVKYRPPENRTPTKEEIDDFLPYLRKELAIIQPDVIITLGATASKLFTEDSITEARGKPIEFTNDWIDFTVVPTFHPSYILRNSDKIETLIADFRTAMDLTK